MESLISSGLPALPAGLADKEYNLVAPVYRAVNALADRVSSQLNAVQYSATELSQISPITAISAPRTNRIPIKAGEALSYGHLIYLTIVDGKFVAFKADNTVSTGKRAMACVDSPGGLAINEFGEAVFLSGLCAGISGTALGTHYFLGTSGGATNVQSVGKIQQPVGIGLGSAGLFLTITAEVVSVIGMVALGGGSYRVHYTDGTYVDI